MHGLCQPGPVEQGPVRFEALIGQPLIDSQEQGRRQSDAIGVAHHDFASITGQPLLQLW